MVISRLHSWWKCSVGCHECAHCGILSQLEFSAFTFTFIHPCSPFSPCLSFTVPYANHSATSIDAAYNMYARSSCYKYSLVSIYLILIFFIRTNTLSEATPLPFISNGIDYEPPSGELLNLKGPLLCHGNLTTQLSEPQDYPLFCDGGIFCQGITSCNDTLVCSRDWVNLNGTLVCNGEISCNGTLNCNKGPAHPACLPGLGGLPPPALAILIVSLVVISGGLSGLKSAFMSNPSLPRLKTECLLY